MSVKESYFYRCLYKCYVKLSITPIKHDNNYTIFCREEAVIIMDNELTHYGVLGMKWGVRKADKIGSRKDGFTIKKGATIYRTAVTDSEKNKTGHAFVSIDKKDALGYMRRGSAFNQAAYNMTFKVTKDLVAPSMKVRVDEFIKLLDSDESFKNALATSQAQYNIFSSPDKIKKKIDQLKTYDEKARLYKKSLALGVASNSEVRDKYFKSLSDLGYNMMIDDADAGVVSRVPSIVFDRQDSLEVISIKPVTRQSIRELKKQP